VHKYFNPYGTPYEAFINYMNVLSDFIIRVEKQTRYAKTDVDEVKEAAKKLFEKTGKLARGKARQTKRVVKETLDKTKEIKFEDIKNMSDTAVKKLLHEIDLKKLSIAMEDAGVEIREKILPNLGKRARKQFDEWQEEIKKAKKSDIKKYKKEIEDKLRDLFGKKK